MGKAGAFHYAVKKGRAPGIYPTWEEAQKEVKNFRDARYKKFRDLGEAQDWMNEVEPVAGPSNSTSATRTNPVFSTELLTEAKYTAFTSSTPAAPSSSTTTQTTSAAMRASETFAVPASATPATAPPSLRYEPLEKHRVEIGAAAGAKTSGAGDERWEFLYTDGACRNNGKPNAIAGIGVWWGRGDRRNISERCPGTQTNNRAELLAIIRALEVIPHSTRPLTIHTDSEYCVNAFTKWRDGWLRRNWRTALGEPVANQPMIKYLTALLALRLRRGQDVELKWVKGHAGNVGNEGADKLAVDGYDLPMIEERDWMALRDETDEIENDKPEVGRLMVRGQAVVLAKEKGNVSVKAAVAVKSSANATVSMPSGSRSGSAPKPSKRQQVKVISLDEFNVEELDPELLLDDAAMEEMARTGNFDL